MNTHDSSTRSLNLRLAIILISLAAGAGDFASGLLLVLAPQMALKAMRVPMIQDWVLLQWIGVFVACVGASYLLGLIAWRQTGSPSRLRVVWELTLLFRLAVGTFVMLQIGTAKLPLAWISVSLTDWTWALLQAALLKRGFVK